MVGSSAVAQLTVARKPIEHLCGFLLWFSGFGLPVIWRQTWILYMSSLSRSSTRSHWKHVRRACCSHWHPWFELDCWLCTHLWSLFPIVLFSTETQMPHSSDASHLQFPNYLLHPCFLSKDDFCVCIHRFTAFSPLPYFVLQFSWLTILFTSFNRCFFCTIFRSYNRYDPLLLTYFLQILRHWLQQTPAVKLPFLAI